MRTVVVTGTDHGLGRALVGEFGRRGFHVFAGSHELAKRNEGPREISAALAELPLDVTDPSLVKALAETVARDAPGLDVLELPSVSTGQIHVSCYRG